MSNIQARKRPYEALFRFNEDGSVGAHYQEISEYLESGAVAFARVEAPIPLNLLTEEKRDQLIAVFGPECVRVAAESMEKDSLIQQLRNEIQSLQDAVSNLQEKTSEVA